MALIFYLIKQQRSETYENSVISFNNIFGIIDRSVCENIYKNTLHVR